MKPYILTVVFITTLFLLSCQKGDIAPPASINATPLSSNATLDVITSRKTEGKYSDTMTIATDGNGVVLTGNSLMQRWIYYNWDATWKGIPMINRAFGGTKWRDLYPYIDLTITCYHPKVIIMYQGENEHAYANANTAPFINIDFIKYYDEVRRQNPAARLVVESMLQGRHYGIDLGFKDDITQLNNYYKQKVIQDSLAGNKATYLDIVSLYPYQVFALWRVDNIHIDDYKPLTIVLKPLVQKWLAESPVESPVTVTKQLSVFGNVANWPDTSFRGRDYLKSNIERLTFTNLLSQVDSIKDAEKIFIFAGDVDVENALISSSDPASTAAGTTAKVTTAATTLYESIRSKYPNSDITFIGIKQSPKFWGTDAVHPKRNLVDYVNNNIKNYISRKNDTKSHYVDPNPGLLNWPKAIDAASYELNGIDLSPKGWSRLNKQLVF